ncbi:MAG: PhzF family phenazine biosynthesis protein [Nitrospinota bacterium]|nr:MAG: PhzF family phenazine biosynthesis protein [Nitrospinota bacterium]
MLRSPKPAFIPCPVSSVSGDTDRAIRRAKIVEGLYQDLIPHTDAKALLLFCPETYKPTHHFHGRVFAGYYGVPEDPGTGSANGAFAPYLCMTATLENFGSYKLKDRSLVPTSSFPPTFCCCEV